MAKPPKSVTAVSFVKELIACGKGCCRTCGGTKLAHGPYWYGYYSRKNGSTGKVYVGKDKGAWMALHGIRDTGGKRKQTPPKKAIRTAKPRTPKKRTPKPNPDWLKMTSRAATPLLAARILGVKPGITRSILTLAFKDRIKTAHPDKGGSTNEAMAVNAAYAMLKPLCK